MENTKDNELLFNRVLDAPVELVWKAWTNPIHLANWWGPTGFTLTTYQIDVRAGSTWRFTMHGPDGKDYPNKIRFLEVVEHERLAYEHVDDGDTEGVAFQVKVTFQPEGAITRLSMRMTFASAEELQRIAREYGAIEGAHQTLARLAEELSQMKKEYPSF